jgi:hypothetical protein
MDDVCKDDADFNSLREIVFALAKEAAAPSSRNRAAVFVSLIKSQLGYIPPCRQAKPYERLQSARKTLLSQEEKVQEQKRRLFNERK